MEPISAILLVKQGSEALKSALTAASSLRDLFKGDKKALNQIEEIQEKVLNARQDLISAQEMIQTLQSQLSSESDKVRSLEKELTQIKESNNELQEYKLHEIVPGKFVRTPKESLDAMTPAHHICENCAQKRIKSILQKKTQGSFVWLVCHNCHTEIEIKAPRGGVWTF
ncbi:hypothetical protein HX889_41855 [Pseudomonas reactans]|nr:hypothetical protein [Pseudomonas reactans]